MEILNFKIEFYCFLALNLLAQFSRQIVIQILGLEFKNIVGISQYAYFRIYAINATILQNN
jgi:hypothetical protein